MTSPPPPSLQRYWLGLALSAAVTALLLWIDVAVISHPDMGYGGIFYLLAAMFIGGPLAMALLVTWLVYMFRARGNLPRRVHLWMWMPPLLSLFVIPVASGIQRVDAADFSERHPPILETHVNLSGRPLWLGPDVQGTDSSGALPERPLRPWPEARFVSFTRYPGKDELVAGTFPYDGTRLRDGIDTYAYGVPDPGGEPKSGGPSVPLIRLPYPDLHELTPYESEDSLLVYQYFHYGDRVEVAPAIARMAATTEDKLLHKVPRLVEFYASNRTLAIARAEVNGQALAVGASGPIAADPACQRAYIPIGYALVDPGAPLKLRWQTLDDPTQGNPTQDSPWHWHEASLTLPPWKTSKRGIAVSFPSVLLYFTGGDGVAAERFELLELGDRRGLLATGRPAGVPADKVCGSAADGYGPGVRVLR